MTKTEYLSPKIENGFFGPYTVGGSREVSMKLVECDECNSVTGDPHYIDLNGNCTERPVCPSCHMRGVTKSVREAVNKYDLEDGRLKGQQYKRRPTDAI